MNESKRQAITLALTLLALIGLGVGFGELSGNRETNSAVSQETQTIAPIIYQGAEGQTVLDLLKSKHTAVTQDSSFGTYVSSINGKSGDADSAWLYYIDGQLGQEAADKAVTKDGQSIEWRYESF